MTTFILVIILSIDLSESSTDVVWPEVREFEISVGFGMSATKFEVTIPIYNESGKKEYWIKCVGGDDEYLDRLSGESGINYVGPLSCRLDLEDRESGFSLLGVDDSPVWHTRGQFHLGQLVGSCGSYPEFGRVRNFRLRGFRLTLEARDIVFSRDKSIDYFLLKISVQKDAAAVSASAAPPGYLDPALKDRSCNEVLLGNDPRFCRNTDSFTREECPSNP